MTKYFCCDGDSDIVIEADTPREAAQEFVDDGDWAAQESTWWCSVSVQEIDDAGEVVGRRERHKIAVDPEEPDCILEEHDWQSPHAVLGGLEENPGVWGHGGGAYIRQVCAGCGRYRLRDTWAQDPADGEQGLESVEYPEADERSLAWASSQG